MINIHCQKGMVCLSNSEFDRVVKHMAESEKQIALLEESLRIAENELKELRYMRESLEK